MAVTANEEEENFQTICETLVGCTADKNVVFVVDGIDKLGRSGSCTAEQV